MNETVKIRLATANGGLAVDAVMVGEYFAIHEWYPVGDYDRDKGYELNVTHVPTGYCVAQVKTEADGRRFVEALLTWSEVDWSATDLSYFKETTGPLRSRALALKGEIGAI